MSKITNDGNMTTVGSKGLTALTKLTL